MNNVINEKTTIIAEVASNHNGDLETAFKLIEISAECGADIVKFQSFLVDDLLAQDDPNYARLKNLQMPREWYPKLMKRCEDNGVKFLSTATNFKTLEWMEEFGAWGYKVASCNITHRPLIDRLIEIGKPLIISTGLARLEEITDLANLLRSKRLKEFVFLHCVSRYPTPSHEMRLRNIEVLKMILSCPVGLSDHSPGPWIPAVAVALGASVIEKHISLDKQGVGLDHEVAILPDEFSVMCRMIRETEKALRADFSPDKNNMHALRRSLHFCRNKKAGEAIHEEDIKIVRPEDGLMPKFLDQIIGRKTTREVFENQPICWEHVEKTDE